MRRPQNQQVYAFIDSQNLNVSTQKLGWKMDWAKFRMFLADKYGVTKAFMFIGYVPEFEDMYVQLHETGYAVVLKPTFDMTKPYVSVADVSRSRSEEQQGENEKRNRSGGPADEHESSARTTKGNIDADLVLWAMKEMPNYSKAVIVSGDGDFYTLVEYLDQQHKLHKLLAPSGHYSGLFNRFDKYIERLDQHRRELAYRDFKKHRKQ